MTAGLLMAALAGRQPTGVLLSQLAERTPAGLTLFRHYNVGSTAELRALTDALQAAVPSGRGPLLIAADQEGGQLVGLGDETTPFAGAMALGAVGDVDLAERVGRATAREMRALGVNVNYAPVCDLATEPANPALGIRSFGDDPAAVAQFVAATVRGLQGEGVAATAKHFPGKGDVSVDTHHQLGLVRRSRDELDQRELVPFRAAVAAGVRLVMVGHVAVPAITGDDELPASIARPVLTDLLRDELGFEGLAITDALDMRALAQGDAQGELVVSAVRAGVDLLLGTPDPVALARIEQALTEALHDGRLDAEALRHSERRLAATRAWLSGFDQPALDVVGCADHRELARELAERSLTLVRDHDALLPLRPGADARLAVIMPRPADLTPADTSSHVAPLLAADIRRRHPNTDELLTVLAPGDSEIAALAARAAGYDVLVVGTIAASSQPKQAELVRTLIATGRPTITIALRTPWDLASYPAARTHACSYGILAPSMAALAGALFGEIDFRGRLPVELSGLHRRGHGLSTGAH